MFSKNTHLLGAIRCLGQVEPVRASSLGSTVYPPILPSFQLDLRFFYISCRLPIFSAKDLQVLGDDIAVKSNAKVLYIPQPVIIT